MLSGMTAASPTRGDRSRRAILDAARPIFAREGYAAASLNQIIEASGLTKGGCYFHFPSKQALALAVIADHQQGLLERVVAEVNQHPTAVERLFATPRVLTRLEATGEGPSALGKLIEELARDPDLRDEVCGGIQLWIDAAAAQFREAQREGAIRADLDPQLLGEVVVGCHQSLQGLTAQLGDGRFTERLEAFIQVVQLATVVDQQTDPVAQRPTKSVDHGGPAPMRKRGGRR